MSIKITIVAKYRGVVIEEIPIAEFNDEGETLRFVSLLSEMLEIIEKQRKAAP